MRRREFITLFSGATAAIRPKEPHMLDPAFLKPGRFVESDAAPIVDFARSCVGNAEAPIDMAVRLYYAVRDSVLYDPYQAYAHHDAYSARVALERGRGFCIAKAALLAACARAVAIPARLGFADVRNHLATPRLIEMNGSDVFGWHGYTELWLEGKFVKTTPAFNLSMCHRFDVTPLEFDGHSDSILHPYDRKDRRHMEYLVYRGTYTDVPVEEIIATFCESCPRLLEAESFRGGDFANEAGRFGGRSSDRTIGQAATASRQS
jgi:transglutaminase-like putative cysteine protease